MVPPGGAGSYHEKALGFGLWALGFGWSCDAIERASAGHVAQPLVEYDPRVLQHLLAICALKPFELDECLCIGDAENARVNRSAFEGDPSGFEAFVNHVHLGDLWAGQASPEPDGALLHAIARLVISSWAVSLLPLLGGRSVLFYAGGGTSVGDFTLRFHVDRNQAASWVDLGDRAFLQEEAMRVWRFDAGGLREADAGAENDHT
jgi:hypothetical protein